MLRDSSSHEGSEGQQDACHSEPQAMSLVGQTGGKSIISLLEL